MPGVRFRVAVASGKGGVGKSTLAANLAVAAAKNGLKVGLMDADIHGPSVPMLFGLRDARPQADSDKRIIPLQAHGVVVMSIGFLVPEETAVIWRGPMVQGALVQLMRDVAWENLDLLIMDMPPGTGDAALTLCQQANLSGAVVVATPQDLALADARKGLRMFERLGIPVLGLVENMSGFRCPHCGETSDIFGHGGVRDEARRLGTDLLAEIPLDPALRLASDAGTPLTALEPDSALGQIYRDLAQKVWSKLT
ncbi:MAG: Mrp/NBP35 family ATP-binding protein [Alphaproteobacteria bacterium]|nr:MAG: Mrp/NBP35 family ATP-binding protein [Alphaproteobacteria bacterium]